MTQLLVKTIADFSTTLTTKTAIGATTATLTSGLDLDGVQLPTGTYGFTIDRNNAQKEHFTATLTTNALTGIQTVTRGTGTGTSGFLRTHRKGAEVIITDHVAIKRMMNVLDGTTSFNSTTPLGYDGTATISSANQFATKAYADAIAAAGAPTATIETSGISRITNKSTTNFETAGRFILTGDVAPTFANTGMMVAPGATATHYARGLWNARNWVFNNTPTFICTTEMYALGAGDGVGFIGLGLPTITGAGMTETGVNYCGFEFKKTGGVTTLIAVQCDGGGVVTFSGTLLTLSDGQEVDLYIKINAGSINYFTRVNGGALSAATTLSATLPTGSETNISFVMSNKSSANNMQVLVKGASLEY